MKPYLSVRLFTLCAVFPLALSCQYDPYAHRFTTIEPKHAEVVGRYLLVTQTLVPGDLTPMKGRSSTIELRMDRTFVGVNIPASGYSSPSLDLFNGLLSDSGTWRIIPVGSVSDGRKLADVWGIELTSGLTSVL